MVIEKKVSIINFDNVKIQLTKTGTLKIGSGERIIILSK